MQGGVTASRGVRCIWVGVEGKEVPGCVNVAAEARHVQTRFAG